MQRPALQRDQRRARAQQAGGEQNHAGVRPHESASAHRGFNAGVLHVKFVCVHLRRSVSVRIEIVFEYFVYAEVSLLSRIHSGVWIEF